MSSSSHAENPPVTVIKQDPDAPQPEAPQPTPRPTAIDQEGRSTNVGESYESILKNLGYSDVLTPISAVILDMNSLPEHIKSNPNMLLGLRTQVYTMELIRKMHNFQEASDNHQSRPIMIDGVTSLANLEMPSPDEAQYSLQRKVLEWLIVDSALSVSSVPRTASPSTVPSVMKDGGTDDESYDHDEPMSSNVAALPLAPSSSQRPKGSGSQQDDNDLPVVDQKRANPQTPPIANSADDGIDDHDGAMMPGETAMPIALAVPPSPLTLTSRMGKTLASMSSSSQRQKSSGSQQDDNNLPVVDQKRANPQTRPMKRKLADTNDSTDDHGEPMTHSETAMPIALAVPSYSVTTPNLDPQVDPSLASSSRREEGNELPTDRKKAKKQAPPTSGSPANTPPFKCSFCKRVFEKKGNRNRHLLRAHNIEPYKCDHCSKRFQFWKSLCHHMKERHDTLQTGAKEGRPASKTASKVPDSVQPGNPAPRHLRIILTRCDEEELAPPPPATDPERYICVCRKKFPSIGELNAHYQSEHRGKSS